MYSIDLCSSELITKSWRQRSRVATKKTVPRSWVGRRTAAVSVKQTSVILRQQTVPGRRARHGEATWAVAGAVLVRGIRSSLRAADRSWRLRVTADSWTHIDARYGSTIWCWHLNASKHSLNSIRFSTGSQWRLSRKVGVMWSNFRFLTISRAAAFTTDWKGRICTAATRWRTLLQPAVVHTVGNKSVD